MFSEPATGTAFPFIIAGVERSEGLSSGGGTHSTRSDRVLLSALLIRPKLLFNDTTQPHDMLRYATCNRLSCREQNIRSAIEN
jgi:hypothetical protein